MLGELSREQVEDIGSGALISIGGSPNDPIPGQRFEVLVQCLHDGLVEVLFRLNGPEEVLKKLGLTEWTGELMGLRAVWEVDGCRIDGTDPKNITVAFRRK